MRRFSFCAAILFVSAACGSEEPSAADRVLIRSADGRVELEFDVGDGPVPDIEIVPTDPGLEGFVDTLVYRFEPAGLRFDSPATLRFLVDALSPPVEAGELEIGLVAELLGEDGATVTGVQHFETTLRDGLLETQIEHFSTYGVAIAVPQSVIQVDHQWVDSAGGSVATWDDRPTPVACHRECPYQWRDRASITFERAHDPQGSLAAPWPSGLQFQLLGTVGVTAERFVAGGNPNAPDDTTLYLRSISTHFYGSTLHAGWAQPWPLVRARGSGMGPVPGVCNINGEAFEVRPSQTALTCSDGACPEVLNVPVEVDWLNADSSGINAEIPVRVVRRSPSGTSGAAPDPVWEVTRQSTRGFTVTINTGADRDELILPAAALDAESDPGPWVFALEFDGPIQLQGQNLDTTACNTAAPTVRLTIQ